ncbi:hypothetical protein SUGI_0298270 [Cryptomeria japonica]|uniref:ethylene-responsive transcription factor RAP2-1-like n=1 Tax=Cryptomeria japonica TaxID=3369 RepID=UPI002408A24D|nr:ethylene-responsive transcription factor RAP2-1-like [Cryptomeria japonica]GLJ17216.1 hypothetical protein SUGI_0298270 [Cryptomeria japonica]
MPNDGEEIRYRGVRKRKLGIYVAEIRSGKRSRISLGSYSTAYAAARAYDTALLCLRGPDATSFNFPDSEINSTALEVATAQTNPSPQAVRTAAIAVGSANDTFPQAGASIEETAPAKHSIDSGGAVKDEAHQVEEEEENDIKYLLQSPEHRALDDSVQMAPLHPDLQVVTRPYDKSEHFYDFDGWDAPPKPPT